MNTVPVVEALGVGPLQPFHPYHQVRLRCLQQKMVMVRHEDEGMNLPTGSLAGLAQTMQKMLSVLIIAENGFTVIAAAHHMVACP